MIRTSCASRRVAIVVIPVVVISVASVLSNSVARAICDIHARCCVNAFAHGCVVQCLMVGWHSTVTGSVRNKFGHVRVSICTVAHVCVVVEVVVVVVIAV